MATKVFLFMSLCPFTYIFKLYVYYNLRNSSCVVELRQYCLLMVVMIADGGDESPPIGASVLRDKIHQWLKCRVVLGELKLAAIKRPKADHMPSLHIITTKN